MLRFLKKLRKTLIDSLPASKGTAKQAGGSVQKYVLYALGEILLVMIGILLALQVNNWNEDRKSKKVEIIYLNGLKQNLLDSREELNRVIEESDITVKSLQQLVDVLKRVREDFNNKEIDSLMFAGMSYTVFQTRQGIIDELISSGQVSIIKNDYLRSQIASWDGNLIGIRETEEMSKSGFYDYADRLGSYFDFSGITPEDKVFTVELKKQFFNDLKTRNTLANNRETSRRLSKAYLEKKQHIDTLIQVIDQELKTKYD